MGSGSKTSNPAAERCPRSSASTRAAESTRLPRLTFTRIAPGFIRAIVSRLIMCRVWAVEGKWSVMRSLWGKSSSGLAGTQPLSRIWPAGTAGSWTSTRHLNACNRRTTSRPIRPKPMTPTVRSHSAFMAVSGTAMAHRPVANADTVNDDMARRGQDQCQGMIGHFIQTIVGNIANRNAPGAGGVQIDVVDAHAIPNNDLHPTHGGDHVGIDEGELGQDVVRVGNQRGQFRRCGDPLVSHNFAAKRLEDAFFDLERTERAIRNDDLDHVLNNRQVPRFRGSFQTA